MTADLHCHTRLSDGSTGIEELISIARRRHIRCLAVTDHDTMAGCVRAMRLGERYGIKVIHGVEFSAYDYSRNRRVHILCYGAKNPNRLEGLCSQIGKARKAASIEMIKKVMKLYPITPEQVAKCAAGSTNIFKQHIMRALMDCGYDVTMFGSLYNELFSSNNGSCYVAVEYPDVNDVINLIHEAGGIAVMAHPPVYDSFDLLDELSRKNLDGVEVWHSRSTAQQTEQLASFAAQRGLLTTGGSDFHGMYTKNPTPLATCVAPHDSTARLIGAML